MAEELMHVVAQDAELCRGLQELPHDERALRRLYQLAQILMREEARQTILSAGVKEEAPFFLLEQYRLCIEEGKDVTSLREKLLKSDDYHIHFTMAMIDFQERASKLCEPLEVIKPLESYLERFGDQDEHNVWRIEMMMAELYLDADEWKTALKHAETAYENAPKTFQGEIEHSMDYIKSQIR